MIACALALPLQARAGLIDSGAAAAPASAPVDRGRIARQLEAFGIEAQAARERAAALTDAEAAELVLGIERQAAGGEVAIASFGVMMILVFLVYKYWREVFDSDLRK